VEKLIVANWKMNPATEKEAVALARAIDSPSTVICPPFPFLKSVGSVLKKGVLGAQDLFWEETVGPYTGEVSAQELKDAGVRYVIIGHSERRATLRETDGMIAKKLRAAINAGITPILCVGEKLAVREKGEQRTFLFRQLEIDLALVQEETARVYIAYEPIWAIGTGQNDTPEDAEAIAEMIKAHLKKAGASLDAHVLYGGSVNAQNARGFFEQKEIEGALVGGASLKPEEFLGILAAGRT
jgi:triosephosphate isomerase (TIM)